MQVLARLKSPDLHEKHARGIAGVLYSFVKEGEPSNVSDPLLEEAGKIARALWKHLRLVKPGIEQGDLLRIAINHPAGTIGQFWCASHSLWREQDKSHSDTFITIYREALSEIAQDRTLSGRHGRAVLARNFTYLLDTDGDWTRDNLLPLFENPRERGRLPSCLARIHVRSPYEPASCRTNGGALSQSSRQDENHLCRT